MFADYLNAIHKTPISRYRMNDFGRINQNKPKFLMKIARKFSKIILSINLRPIFYETRAPNYKMLRKMELITKKTTTNTKII